MRIDLYHDTVCPWCRIGMAHLKAALEQWQGEPVTVHYHAFLLDPTIPPEGIDFRNYMQRKGGGQVPLEQWFAAPREQGRRAGLTFHFERIERAPASTPSHELIALAPAEQREEIIEAIHKAYFEHGRDIGQIDELVAIAAAHELDAGEIRRQLHERTKSNEVLADAATAGQLGITGVPFFVVNRRLAFQGAQPPEVILDVLRQAQNVQSRA